MHRWHIKTTNTQTGDKLSTIEMPNLAAYGVPALGYRYESCLFMASGDSDVKRRYNTQEDAEAGHELLVAEFLGTKQISNGRSSDDA